MLFSISPDQNARLASAVPGISLLTPIITGEFHVSNVREVRVE
jgi:hypothetical protein